MSAVTQELTERLIAEHPTVPAGQVVAAVLRADNAVPLFRSDADADRLAMCASLARTLLRAA